MSCRRTAIVGPILSAINQQSFRTTIGGASSYALNLRKLNSSELDSEKQKLFNINLILSVNIYIYEK